MAIKKFLSLLLAVLTAASMAVTALAQETDPSTSPSTEPTVAVSGSQSADVTINITDEDGNPLNPAPVYRVVITWKDLEFKVQATKIHWIPVGQYYWLEDGILLPDQSGSVTVTNHSNAPVTVTAAFEGAADDEPLVSQNAGGITATMALTVGESVNGAVTIPSAEGCGDTPPFLRYTVTPSGDPKQVPALEYTVDKINLSIQK